MNINNWSDDVYGHNVEEVTKLFSTTYFVDVYYLFVFLGYFYGYIQ